MEKNQDAKQTTNGEIKLKKEIGILQGVSIIVGIIVGSGIFVSPLGVIKYTRSVGLSFVMWIVTAVFSTLGALVYAELGVTIPKSGGEYIYVLKTFGNVPAFLTLWITFFIIGGVSCAANSLIFAQYVIKPFFSSCDIPQPAIYLVAIWGLLTLCFINCYNVKWATKVAIIFTCCKVAALLIITAIGIYYLAKGNVENFHNSFKDSNDNIGDLAFAFYQGFWAYAGWNYLNFLVEEMKNPSRNLPIAIIISLFLVTVIYLMANVAYLAVLSPHEMLTIGAKDAAVAVAFAERSMGVMAWCMPIFVGASVFGSMNGEFLSMSRLTFTGAQYDHMPSVLAMVSYKLFTPIPSVILFTFFSIVFSFSKGLDFLIELAGFAFCIIAGFAVSSLIYLRIKCPNMQKKFKLPLFVPILFLILNVFIGILTIYQQPFESMISLTIMLLGLPIYIVFIAWKTKPRSMKELSKKLTIAAQKMCFIVPEDGASMENKAEK